jgi:hypothetical protein
MHESEPQPASPEPQPEGGTKRPESPSPKSLWKHEIIGHQLPALPCSDSGEQNDNLEGSATAPHTRASDSSPQPALPSDMSPEQVLRLFACGVPPRDDISPESRRHH